MNYVSDRKIKDFYKDKKVLVTGGAGFLGSHLAEFLVEDGARVTVVDTLERGRLENLGSVIDEIDFTQQDLRDFNACKEVARGKDVVINMAAKVTGIHYNRLHHGDMFTQNMMINTNTLEAARLNNVPRYCVVSTACIYPRDAEVPTLESEGDKGTPEPTNEGYGWSKLMAENRANIMLMNTVWK